MKIVCQECGKIIDASELHTPYSCVAHRYEVIKQYVAEQNVKLQEQKQE